LSFALSSLYLTPANLAHTPLFSFALPSPDDVAKYRLQRQTVKGTRPTGQLTDADIIQEMMALKKKPTVLAHVPRFAAHHTLSASSSSIAPSSSSASSSADWMELDEEETAERQRQLEKEQKEKEKKRKPKMGGLGMKRGQKLEQKMARQALFPQVLSDRLERVARHKHRLLHPPPSSTSSFSASAASASASLPVQYQADAERERQTLHLMILGGRQSGKSTLFGHLLFLHRRIKRQYMRPFLPSASSSSAKGKGKPTDSNSGSKRKEEKDKEMENAKDKEKEKEKGRLLGYEEAACYRHRLHCFDTAHRRMVLLVCVVVCVCGSG